MNFSEQLKLIKSTKQIHSTWYRETYPEVAELGLDPATHYLRYGAAMGRNPGKDFDTQFYLDTYPEAAESGLNPLVHYALHGQAAGHATRPRREDPRKQINVIRTKLLSLGFTERPLAELTEMATTHGDPAARAMAARELALWHMRARTEADYRIALDWIARARAHAPDLDFRAKLSTVELLCHYHLGDHATGCAAYDRAGLAGEATPDLMLVRVNFEPSPERRVAWINAVLARYDIAPVTLLPDEGQPAYDRLTCAVALPKVSDGPKVSVLVAAYDAAKMLPTALRSLQEQTWTNLEIIVLDDCSPSLETMRVAECFAASDPRIQVVRMPENGGAYVARNHGLDMATGEFVTLHDADYWSHPKKIETQVRFMMENPEVMGCTSEQARATNGLVFISLHPNESLITVDAASLLIRRQPVFDTLGYWDSVRFGAGRELVNRIKAAYGEGALDHLDNGPFSFQRVSAACLSEDEPTNVETSFFGAFKEYSDAQSFHHRSGRSLKYSRSTVNRAFPVPSIFVSGAKDTLATSHFDLIILGEFRVYDEETKSLLSKLEERKASGERIGLVECHRYTCPISNGRIDMCDEVRALVDGGQVKVLVYGDRATCSELWQHRTSQDDQRYLPEVMHIPSSDTHVHQQPAKAPGSNTALIPSSGRGNAGSSSPRDKPGPLELLHEGINYDEEALRTRYKAAGLDKVADTFALVRIIGNDLVPRHAKGQSRENLRFVLANEPDLQDCTKLWIVNRIFDPEERVAILKLLEDHGQSYTEIPFDNAEYRRIGWDFETLPSQGYLASREFQDLGPLEKDRVRTALYRLKNLYVMNNNGARNAAVEAGLATGAKWVLPWDGNCFLTASAWKEITGVVRAKPFLRRFAVPMQRMSDNDTLLRDDFTPDPLEEPQLLFRRDAPERFNPDFPYGRRPKVELFWHLGITGAWDRWRDDPWEMRRREKSPEAGQYDVAGWVARMYSGMKALEQQGDISSFKNRGRIRQEAIVAAIDHIDARIHADEGTGFPAFYDTRALTAAATALQDAPDSMLGRLAGQIMETAEAVLVDGPYSVTEKTTLPPSGNIRDYWHPAPYWWPDPSKPDGLPYVKKDGQRVPGTRMYEPESTKYDRTRLQLMFDNTTTLALAWKLTGRNDFAEHGARLVRAWFLDPATCMAPHLTYAQVRRGHDKDEGQPSGVIEFKDFYFLLDAVRLLEEAGSFTDTDRKQFTSWLRDYLEWLETSPQGLRECRSINNHGTYYDLQTAAICAYLNEDQKLRDIMLRAQSRLAQQIEKDGIQPDEMKRSITQHYVFFNLQGLLNIFRVAQAAGCPPLDFGGEPGIRLRAALDWILRHDLQAWPYEQIDAFDHDRIWPLLNAAQELGVIAADELPEPFRGRDMTEMKPIFDPHHAVNPYWNI